MERVLEFDGWVALDGLVPGMCADCVSVACDNVLMVVVISDMKRFTLFEDGTSIRAAHRQS